MTQPALSRVSPQLVDALTVLDGAMLRQAVRAACTLAVHRAGLADPRAVEALTALEAGQVGDGPERDSVHAMTEELDQIAWDVQDKVEAGAASPAEYRRAFARARAAAALDEAFGIDPLRSALEALYEAHYAIEDVEALLAAVGSAS